MHSVIVLDLNSHIFKLPVSSKLHAFCTFTDDLKYHAWQDLDNTLHSLLLYLDIS